MTVSRQKWDEAVPLHVASELYDVPAFLRGRNPLDPLEIREMGPVRGRSLLHLQCHFGLDTLSWARLGATVTGVDYSLPAVRAARRVARQAGLAGRFVHSNIYDVPKVLHEEFDIVYTGKGAITWLPDLERWAEVIDRFLKPGGRFYLVEDHPLVEVFPNDGETRKIEPKLSYFEPAAVREEFDGTYATRAKMRHRVSYSWFHTVSQILNALTRKGLRIQTVREYPFTYWKRWSWMTRDGRGYWHLPELDGALPLMWSVTARKPAVDR
jgi:SAM-dependent methyltransferase